jgi:hypothetical protein
MRSRLTDILVMILMVEGVVALTLLIVFTIYRILTGN